jgi:hypothetical protein
MKKILLIAILTVVGCVGISPRISNKDIADSLFVVCYYSKPVEYKSYTGISISAVLYNLGKVPVCCSLEPDISWSRMENGKKIPIPLKRTWLLTCCNDKTFKLLLPRPRTSRILDDKPKFPNLIDVSIDTSSHVTFPESGHILLGDRDGEISFDCPIGKLEALTNKTFELTLTFDIFRNDKYDTVKIVSLVQGNHLARLANKSSKAPPKPGSPQ